MATPRKTTARKGNPCQGNASDADPAEAKARPAPDGGPDYAVGRGKPPPQTRFKPGQSGNPGGRPKGSRNFKTLLQEILETSIDLTENGRKRSIPMLEALIKRQAQEGLRGSMRAIDSLLDRYERHAAREPALEDDEFPDRDAAILERALALRDLTSRNHTPAHAGDDYEADAQHDCAPHDDLEEDDRDA